MPFDRSVVRQLARDAASKPYKAPDTKLPDNLKNLDYDHYRQIRFLPEHALWRGEKLPFQVQFFHRGFFYAPRVDIYEVANGQATKIAYRPDDFSFGDNRRRPARYAIWALPAFGFTRRSTGRTIMTRFASSSARAISAPSPRAKSTACRREDLRSIPVRAKGEEFPAVQDVLDREAGRQRQFDRRARAARQRKHDGGLSFHDTAGRHHGVRCRNGDLSARRSRSCRARADDQHVLLRAERPH